MEAYTNGSYYGWMERKHVVIREVRITQKGDAWHVEVWHLGNWFAPIAICNSEAEARRYLEMSDVLI